MVTKIKHLGIVENIENSCLTVRIVQASACAACNAKAQCRASDTKEKLVDVLNLQNIPCHIGEHVSITGTTSMEMKAVLLAFVIPFMIVCGVLFGAMYLTDGNEMLSAVVSLMALVPYYFIIYLARKRLKKVFIFTLDSVEEQ